MRNAISVDALDQLFLSTPTCHGWTDEPVGEDVVRRLHNVFKGAPTSANSSPARFVRVRSPEGKVKLAELAIEKNRAKIITAPLTVIIDNDLDFATRLPELMPYYEAMQKASASRTIAKTAAMRNATLQGGYLITGARDRPGSRVDIGLRRCRIRRSVLRRRPHQVQLRLQPRAWRPSLAVPAQLAAPF